MLAKWTRILPYFIVVLLTKAKAERVAAIPGYSSANPYSGEIFSWRIGSTPEGGDNG